MSSLPAGPTSLGTTRAFVVVSNPVANEVFAGRTLIDRHREILTRAGVADVSIVTSERWRRLEQEPADWTGRRIVVRAERIFDPRLYAAALQQPTGVRFVDLDAALGLEAFDAGQTASAIDISSLPSYSRELRRGIRPYWMRVESVRDRPAVTRLLVDASGKGHQDLPAAVINAPIEKALMRRLANTSITPNQLTLLCNLVAYVVVVLLARGHFLIGAIAALVVGVLDGLDGRQARVQIRTSELGRIEHLLDKVYEILWIASLAYGLSSGVTTAHYARGVLIWIAAYLTDTAAYDIVKWRTGIQLDEVSPVDRVIRVVAGRRNVYTCILLACALVGEPGRGFRLILWWSLVTAAVHTQRAVSIVAFRDDVSSAPEPQS